MTHNLEQKIIQLLQGDLPLTDNPYAALAQQLELSENELVACLEDLHSQGKLKRIAAILHHQQAGFGENAMAVFTVSPAVIDQIGALLAQQSFVSHCYQRQSYPDWPYNLYAMCHSKSPGFIETAIAAFAAQQDLSDYLILPSIQELKKTSLRFG